MKKLNPTFKLRYAEGVGDIVKCFLHSRLFGPITKIITGQSAPCDACQMRSIALNILLPVPIWRIFFKNKEERRIALIEDLKNFGYEFDSLKALQDQKITTNDQESEIVINNKNELEPDDTLSYDKPTFPMLYDNFNFYKKMEFSEKDLKLVILFYKKD